MVTHHRRAATMRSLGVAAAAAAMWLVCLGMNPPPRAPAHLRVRAWRRASARACVVCAAVQRFRRPQPAECCCKVGERTMSGMHVCLQVHVSCVLCATVCVVLFLAGALYAVYVVRCVCAACMPLHAQM